jgi:hypothetical protein
MQSLKYIATYAFQPWQLPGGGSVRSDGYQTTSLILLARNRLITPIVLGQ